MKTLARRPRAIGAAISALGAACGGGSLAGSHEAATVAAPAVTPCTADAGVARDTLSATASYAGLFDSLAARVEKHHQFAESRRAFWDAHKEVLRREFSLAATPRDGLVALRHLQKALGDRHCGLTPPNDETPRRLGLGLRVHAVRGEHGPVVRVAAVDNPELASSISIGDDITAVDGVPTARYLADHPFESNALNPTVALRETADGIVTQVAPWTTANEGDTRVLSFSREGRAFERKLAFKRPFRYEQKKDGKLDLDEAPPMGRVSCTQEPSPPYAGYDVATIGANVCVYRPRERNSSKPPVVRFLSFLYDINRGDEDSALRAIRADHDLLKAALAKDARVVLDLHDNHGGYNPFVFVSWFARAPWGHEQVHLAPSADFSEEEVRSFLYGNDALASKYGQAVHEGKSELSFSFLCNNGPCDAEGPRASELVTNKPVAVVTGPECTSSCDAFSAMWSTFHLGPIVGKQPVHGFTSIRHAFAVVGPNNRDMGKMSIALSWEGYAGKDPLEGHPIALDWEAPETFETRESWVDASVAQAARLLAGAR